MNFALTLFFSNASRKSMSPYEKLSLAALSEDSSSTTLVEHPRLDLMKFAESLRLDADGVWRGRSTEPVSYPAEGNNACFALEDSSFWFAHRNACLLALLRRFPAAGPFFDIGGGNGFVAAAIQ